MLFGLLLDSCKEPAWVDKELTNFDNSETTIKKEIPIAKKGNLSAFYTSTKHKQLQLGLDSLEEGFNGLQIRIWYDSIYVNKQKLVTILYTDGKWKAKVYRMRSTGSEYFVFSKDAKSLTPKTGWDNFSNRLLNLNILTLPDGMALDNCGGGGGDGGGYNIEVATKKHYRFYSYWEPQYYHDKCKYARSMIDILNLIEQELGV